MGSGAAAQIPSSRHPPGELIDPKYRLIRRLGSGGFGEVWVAENLVLNVPVAVKLLTAESGSRAGQERLLREARAAAQLGHPAIVRMFEFGTTTRGEPFIAMELLDGQTLAEHIVERGRVPALRAIQMLLPIADGLAVAHAKGVVHRDIKPENIFLAKDQLGRISPKLLDFGIARVEVDQHITARGAVLGTPSYMSPEQARGHGQMDARSDVWSFCVVLYELMTGQPPFEKENYNALLQSIINDEPLPITTLGAGDEELWHLIATGLEKDPGLRWESMRILGEALALWAYEQGAREDICDASLRSAWLEAEISDVQIVVADLATSKVPPTEPPPPQPAPEPAALPPPSFAIPSKRWWLAGAFGALALLALGLTVLALRSEAPEPSGVEAVASEPAPPSVAAVPPNETPREPPAPTSVASEAPAKRPLPKLATSAAGAPTQPPPTARKPTPAPASTKKIDLGF